MTLTSPFLFPRRAQSGKATCPGSYSTAGLGCEQGSLVVPILASIPSLMPTKPKGLNRRSPPGQPGDMTRRRVKGSQLSSSIGWGSAPPPHTHTHTHICTRTHTHTRYGRGKEPGLIRSPPTAPAALALMYFKECLRGWERAGALGKSWRLPGGPEAVSSPSSGPSWVRLQSLESPSPITLCSLSFPLSHRTHASHCLLLFSGGLGWDAFMEGVVFKLAVVGK